MSQSTREKEVINLVMRQTDYTEEQAKEKLKQWNNNYINVIKEYLNPNFHNQKKEEKPKTLNQQMLGEIRSFMDDVYIKFENRKRYNQYLNVLNEARSKANNVNDNANVNDNENKKVSENAIANDKEQEHDGETVQSSSENQIKIEEVV